MKKTGGVNKWLQKILLIIFLPVMIVLMSSDFSLSQPDDILNILRTSPTLSQAPTIASPKTAGTQTIDPRIKQIENRLRETKHAVQSPQSQPSMNSGIPAGRQEKAVEKLRKRLSRVADIRYRSGNGTPRQIKVKAEARRTGVVLEKASKDSPEGQARDEKTARNFLRAVRGDLRIQDPDNELSLSKYSTDEQKRRHLRYQQKYQGLRVWPAELTVHLDAAGNVDLMNGAFIATPRRLIPQPVWTADQAVRQARSSVPEGAHADAGSPELIIYASEALGPRLAWRMELAVSLEFDWLVVIDALNGNVLTTYNQVSTELTTGSGRDLFGTTRTLDTWRESGRYYLADTSKSMYDTSSNPTSADKTRGGILIYDMAHSEDINNGMIVSSSSATSGWSPDAVSLAYNLSETYDYFYERHHRDSVDNQKGSILGFVRYGQNYKNAFWTSEHNAVFFGDAMPYAGALDVVGHEITHGVTSFTCNLIYQDQSGAMNEALSDIFGEMVEARTLGSTDWVHGTLMKDQRSLQDPSSIEIAGTGYYYPSKMSEFYGRNHPLLQNFVDQDYGGVHINLTIISHCFYLLAQGMAGAIGIADAEKIFYRAQTVHLVSNSQFIDLRLACIASAEELFGENVPQVQKVKEAFDAVEIFDNPGTPEPPAIDPVQGDDAVVFLSYDPSSSAIFLARDEKSLGDSSPGAWLSCYDLDVSRPSVSGNGSLALFVDSLEDACFIPTDGSLCEECLGFSGSIHSVAMSADGQLYGMVLLDEFGEPANSITVIDLRPGGTTRTFDLVAPASEGVTVDTVQYADTMDFSRDNRYLFYDAYNVLEFRDGSKMGVWSIYAIDLITEQTIAIAGPFPGYDIGFPSLGQTDTSLITFDIMDQATGETAVVAMDLVNGDYDGIAYLSGGNWTVPCYVADDSAIVYSIPDNQTNTASSLVRQPLAADSITPSGTSTFYLPDAYAGVMYRRGTFTSPAAEIKVTPASLNFGSVSLGKSQAKTITVSNIGTSDLMIDETTINGANQALYSISGGCTGQTLPPSGECLFTINFIPTSAGVKNATLSIKSNDPDVPVVNVALSGTGISGSSFLFAPSGLAANAVSSRKILLRWTDQSPDKNSCFKIERKKRYCTDEEYQWEQIATFQSNEKAKNYEEVDDFEPGMKYSYRVRAYSGSGNSDYSNCAAILYPIPSVSGTPSAPVNLVATYSSASSVVLSWDEWSSKVTRFEIYRDVKDSGSWTLLGTTAPDVLTYTDNTATNNQTTAFYTYKVQACNNAGCSPPAYKVGMPAQPTGLSASVNAQGKIALSWTDNSDYERGFEIYRKAGSCSSSGSWKKIKQAGISRETVTDGSTVSGTTYSYKIRAYYRSWGIPYVYGYSDWSNCETITAP